MRFGKLPFFLLVLCLLVGCTDRPPQPSGSDKPHLVVYTSHSETVYAPIIKEFQERTGIWVDVQYGGSQVLLEKLAAESSAPVCDVLFGGHMFSHEENGEVFEFYESAEIGQVSPSYRIQGQKSTPFSALPAVIIYNPKIVDVKDVPDSWQSLLDPKWKGRIAFANPAMSSSCYVALLTMMQAYPSEAWQVLQAFAANMDGTLESSTDIASQVADGAYSVGVTIEEVAIRQKRAGLEIAIVYPADYTSVMPDATSLVKNGPNPENAKEFIDFTISQDVQQMLANDLSRRSVREDIGTPDWMVPITDFPVLQIDHRWNIDNHTAILKEWQSMVTRRPD